MKGIMAHDTLVDFVNDSSINKMERSKRMASMEYSTIGGS